MSEPEFENLTKQPHTRIYRYACAKYTQYAAYCRATKQAIGHYCRSRRETYGGWEQEKKVVEVSAVVLIFIYTSIQGCQLLVIRDQERRQLRAYVSTDGVQLRCPKCDAASLYFRNQIISGNAVVSPPDLCPDINNLIYLTVNNFGQTPAYNVSVTLSVEVLKPSTFLPEDFSYPDKAQPVIRNVLPVESTAWLGNGKGGGILLYI